MRILIPSDVFPPDGRGGAAWSAYALAIGLQTRGHQVRVIVPCRTPCRKPLIDHNGHLPVQRVPYAAPSIPFIQNYFRYERFWPRLAQTLMTTVRDLGGVDIIHAQHTQTAAAAVIAGASLGVPVVVTVRDHWPWDYFATGLHGNRIPHPGRSLPAIATDLIGRLGPLRGVLAWPAIPYIVAHLRKRATLLAQADAVIAPSNYIARRLTGIVDPARIHVLPNMVDIAASDAIAATPPQTTWEGTLVLFAGKLEANKGAELLIDVINDLATRQNELPPFTLLIAGDGALRPAIDRALATSGVSGRVLAWVEHDELLRLTARCDVLLFPSNWGEPLARALIEAAALGAPIIAMPTGGTPDIIRHGETGILAPTVATMVEWVIRLLNDPALRQRLGAAARATAAERFDANRLLPRYEALYTALAHRDRGGNMPTRLTARYQIH
ncbi:glycosyltransferase family 4 protein [Chloroflexus aggregans]|uniref:Glycosyl transferase group 1 n=1 Tax=Chloroflexus aggregans (strain MD-66 / DSM 9485) TaxID=326427 RepID=B8GD28_CHLAD|nr:glycosyltransferase family 4 protein [Chloroflexus aggregans]ACL25095.1 glycosyl transferase group 1 [Chloroflexus aggregans DSM 9485]